MAVPPLPSDAPWKPAAMNCPNKVTMVPSAPSEPAGGPGRVFGKVRHEGGAGVVGEIDHVSGASKPPIASPLKSAALSLKRSPPAAAPSIVNLPALPPVKVWPLPPAWTVSAPVSVSKTTRPPSALAVKS